MGGHVGSPLGGRGSLGHLRGCLSGAGLLFLAERSILLTPIHLPSLSGWMRTVRRSSPLLTWCQLSPTCALNELLEAALESHKIRGFRATVEDDDQPTSSYKMPIGGAFADILADIDERVSSTSLVIHYRKVSKLLQYPGACSRKFYRFEGEDITKAKALNLHVMELAGLLSFENLNKTDVIWSSNKTGDMESVLRSIVEATSWVDWWTFAMKSLSLKSTNDACLVCRLSLAGARCQLLVAKTASTL